MIEGSIVALVTPLSPDGSVDYRALAALVEWHIASGTNAIVAVGTTGESATCTREEKKSGAEAKTTKKTLCLGWLIVPEARWWVQVYERLDGPAAEVIEPSRVETVDADRRPEIDEISMDAHRNSV